MSRKNRLDNITKELKQHIKQYPIDILHILKQTYEEELLKVLTDMLKQLKKKEEEDEEEK